MLTLLEGATRLEAAPDELAGTITREVNVGAAASMVGDEETSTTIYFPSDRPCMTLSSR